MAQSSLPLPSLSLSFCSSVSEGGTPTAVHTVWWKVHESPEMCPRRHPCPWSVAPLDAFHQQLGLPSLREVPAEPVLWNKSIFLQGLGILIHILLNVTGVSHPH